MTKGVSSNLINYLNTRINNVSVSPALVESAINDYLRLNPVTSYIHPSSHPATMITQDANHRFVTDTEKASWNATDVSNKVDKVTGSSLVPDSEIAKIHASGSDNQDLSSYVKTDDTRLTDSRIPTTHTHQVSEVTNAIAEGDARLTDARTPITHGHGATDISGTAIIEGDARLSDAREPLTHSHATPIWRTGIATKNITDNSATQNIAHGLGRVPKYVRIDGAVIITTAITQLATGIYDGTNNSGMTVAIGEGTSTAATDAVYTSTTIALGFSPLVATNVFTGANRQTGVITVDATNIIITWTKTGTVGSLVASLIWQCT
jgi:hypothetical protein